MYSFDATYTQETAARAERMFYVRSVLELRRSTTMGPPIFFGAVSAAAVTLDAPSWFTIGFTAMLLVSIITPIGFYFARPASASRLARKYPVRHIVLTSEEVKIKTGDQELTLPWVNVRHVWNAEDSLLLVLSRFAAIAIPVGSLPDGAHDFIVASAKNAA